MSAHADTLVLSGPPSGRKVGLVEDTTEMALVERVRAVLIEQGGPITTSELRVRLRAAGGFVPGLVSLLRAHESIFLVESGTVSLVHLPESTRKASDYAVGSSPGNSSSGAALPVRLQSLALPSFITHPTGADADNAHGGGGDTVAAVQLAAVREVILLDLDNRAMLALEAAAQRALAADNGDEVLVLAFCSTHHNPRIPRLTADALSDLAGHGRLRLLTPQRDRANAADFVLAFWVGWLHANAHADARFVLVSADVSLEQTVGDILKGQGREVLSTLQLRDGGKLLPEQAATGADLEFERG